MTLATPPILGDGAVPAGLLARAHGAARWLAARGVAEGSRIAVDAPDVPAWLLGADLLGAATLVVEPSWTPREREAVLADASPHLVVTDAAPPVAADVPRADGDIPVTADVPRADGDIPVTADVPRADGDIPVTADVPRA
ncbi:AMP-binding protein, partial [Nonomuraea cavernae]|uniref:AMP-binding protein n=1 Tax=Nonomuraea cavernae TaxID=2045107 RepID=UPI0033CDE41F